MDFIDDEYIEILNIFRVESEEIIVRLNNSLLELEKNPKNKDIIVILFRDAHSLKGASHMIEFNTVQDLAHNMEDIFSLAKEDKIQITSKVSDVLYKTVDLIDEIIKNSIIEKKEIFNNKTVQIQISQLNEIKKAEFQVLSHKDNTATDFNLNFLKDNIENINKTITNILMYVMKLEMKFTKNYFYKLLENITELFNYFQEIGVFEIKNKIENIKFKLEVVEKSTELLTDNEINDIQNELAYIVDKMTSICELGDIEVIDYYSYAFENVDKIDDSIEIETSVILSEKQADKVSIQETQLIDILPECISEINYNELKNKIATLEKSTADYPELLEEIKELKEKYTDNKISMIFEKILNIFEIGAKNNLNLDLQAVEVITSGLDYCCDILNNKNSSDDIELIIQQMEIVGQLLEMTVPASLQLSSGEIKDKKNSEDFANFFDTGEIKTLHVNSQKLDYMVSQVGELIATKIKTTKQLLELEQAEISLEEWQKNFTKILRNLKSFEKKYLKNILKEDATTPLQFRQILNAFGTANRTLADKLSVMTQIQRQTQDDDMKMRHLIDDFDGIVKNIRVLPLATVFHLFGRMVRDLAKETNKQVELSISGSETSADKKIIEEIKNPLIHIIRNAIDHGIESPEQRIALGKTSVGKIHINAALLDNKILIEVIDDGQGFDIQKIKEKALNKGFVTKEELSFMSDEDAMNMIFWSGFSTDDVVTNISGRGIGLDVVKSKIAQLNGQVKIISELNKGSCIQIELPVTMATLTAFLIRVSEQTFAIPMQIVESVLCLKESEFYKNNNQLNIIFKNKYLPIYYLSDILNLSRSATTKNLKTILIIRNNNKTIGLIIDKLLGEQEILHKKLAPPIYKLKNISGVTTLATGETCLILNISDIINYTNKSSNKKLSTQTEETLKLKRSKFSKKRILVVDDSITTRTLEMNLLKNIGLNVDSATNPVEALNLLAINDYDLILSDMEMPKMNGLEFLNKIKSDEKYSHIPIIIVSSIHDEQAKRKAITLGASEYITKGEFNQKFFLELITKLLNN